MTEELRIDARPSLERPVLIAAFRGWNDGGQGASLAGRVPRPGVGRGAVRGDRLGELLRLPGDAADGVAGRRRHAPDRLAGEHLPARAAARRRPGCDPAARRRAESPLADVLHARDGARDVVRRRARDHAGLVARRCAAHASSAGDGQRDRPGADRATRPAGVALRRADGDRRRPPRRLRPAPG